MPKINFKVLFILVALIFLCNNSSFAQQIISPEKKGLIQELRKATGSQNINLSVNFTSADIQDTFLNRIESDKELTEAQKSELQKSVSQAKERMDKQIQDFFADKDGIQQLSEETANSVYDKNFTETELHELIKFYQTATGKKSLLFFLSEKNKLADAFGEAFRQKLQEFTKPMVEREQDLLEQQIKEVKRKKLITANTKSEF
jgi:hypothetical protein